jgi:HK97 gp10 family phage protein
MTVTFHLDMSKLIEIIGALPERADKVVRKTAFEVEAAAKVLAPVDTGALKNSIYTVTSKSDGFSAAMGAADELRPGSVAGPIPEDPERGQAFVGPCVNYGIYVELGTHKMAAQPYLYPALAQVGGEWADYWVDLFD